jgi:hypothetical protein
MSATAKSIPFLIELLSYPSVPRRDLVLEVLTAIASSCTEHVKAGSNVGSLQYEIDAYRSISEGFIKYIQLLKDPDPRNRRMAAYLLGILPERHTYSRLAIYKSVKVEQDKQTLTRLIHSLGILASDLPHYRKRSEALIKFYKSYIEGIVATHQEFEVTLVAAEVWSDLAKSQDWFIEAKPEQLPAHIIETLTSAVLNPFHYGEDTIALQKLSALGIHPLAQALADPDMTPSVAHQICREMLDLKFTRKSVHNPKDGLNGWRIYEMWDAISAPNAPHKYGHRQGGLSRLYLPTEALYQDQKFVLNSIVNNDLFWQLPTNLFSFFYGLPDDREGLRKLVN